MNIVDWRYDPFPSPLAWGQNVPLGPRLDGQRAGIGGRAALAPILVLFAPCVLALALSSSPAAGRSKGADLSADTACLTYAAAAANEVTAGPCVTTPAAPVARFGVLELPAIASVVHVRCLAEVMIARIGGLYGP